jgi:hypothetical protein
MPTLVQKNETFQLSAGDVKLTVAHHDGQLGLSSAFLSPSKILAIAPIINVTVGTHSDCVGQHIFIDADIRDVLQQNDNTSLTITVSDNTNSKIYNYSQLTTGPGEVVIYQVTINMV